MFHCGVYVGLITWPALAEEVGRSIEPKVRKTVCQDHSAAGERAYRSREARKSCGFTAAAAE